MKILSACTEPWLSSVHAECSLNVQRGCTVDRLYCKEANPMSGVFRNLDPHPPHRPASVCPPRLWCRGTAQCTLTEGWGVNILEDARHSTVGEKSFFLYIFGGLECVGHSFANVAHFIFLRDVWIRTQRDVVARRRSTNLATHVPQLSHPSPST